MKILKLISAEYHLYKHILVQCYTDCFKINLTLYLFSVDYTRKTAYLFAGIPISKVPYPPLQ